MEVTHQQLDELKENLENKIERSTEKVMEHVEYQFSKLSKGLEKHADHDTARFAAIREDLENKVDYKTFFWVFGIVLTVTMTLFGAIWTEIKETKELSRQTNDLTIQLKTKWDLWTIE